MTIFSFIIGFAWHRPLLFGKTWSSENNPNNIKQKINAPLIFGGTAVMHFIALSALAAVVSKQGSLNGFLYGFFIAVLWIVPAMTGTYLFANRSLKLLAIDSGMYIVLFSISGLVFGI
jgi:hypothetical protein